jgi:hypothetical protein
MQLISPWQAMQSRWEQCGAVSPDHHFSITSNPSGKRRATGPGWSQPPLYSLGGLEAVPYNADIGKEFERIFPTEHPDGTIHSQMADLTT